MFEFDGGYPHPDDFALFSGGDEDYFLFKDGNYRHIIFNLTLQEGWDDPECCFAYIDKSMGSNVQIEQVIGRVLRQPGAQHYADPDLNTAEFFVRMDDRQAFAEIGTVPFRTRLYGTFGQNLASGRKPSTSSASQPLTRRRTIEVVPGCLR